MDSPKKKILLSIAGVPESEEFANLLGENTEVTDDTQVAVISGPDGYRMLYTGATPRDNEVPTMEVFVGEKINVSRTVSAEQPNSHGGTASSSRVTISAQKSNMYVTPEGIIELPEIETPDCSCECCDEKKHCDQDDCCQEQEAPVTSPEPPSEPPSEPETVKADDDEEYEDDEDEELDFDEDDEDKS